MDEYIESTRKGKFYFYGWLLLMSLAIVGLDHYGKSIKNYVRPDSQTVEQLTEVIKQNAKIDLFVTFAMQPIFWLVAIWLYRFGRRIKQSGRYPPPDTQLPFRMRVRKGKKAMYQAWSCDASALILILYGLTFVYFGWLNLKTVEQLLAGV